MFARRIAVAALVASAAALVQPVLAAPVQPGIGIRLLEAPADRRNDPRALSYIVDHVKPGTTFSRKIELSNGTPQPVSLALYPDAARITGKGFEPAEGRTSSKLTSWITVTPDSVQVPPQGRATATVRVAVPPGASEASATAWSSPRPRLPARPASSVESAGSASGSTSRWVWVASP